MDTYLLLTWATVAGILLLFVTLAALLQAINREVEHIGDAGTRFETSHIASQVSALNARLADIHHGLLAIDASLARVLDGVEKQERR